MARKVPRSADQKDQEIARLRRDLDAAQQRVGQVERESTTLRVKLDEGLEQQTATAEAYATALERTTN